MPDSTEWLANELIAAENTDWLGHQLLSMSPPDQRLISLTDLASVPDLGNDISRVGRQIRWFAEANVAMPCLVPDDGIPVPIDLDEAIDSSRNAFLEAQNLASSPADLVVARREELELLARRSRMKYVERAPEDVLLSFRTSLAGFLEFTISAGKDETQTQQAGTSAGSGGPARKDAKKAGIGVAFKVNTKASGLSVRYTERFWFTPCRRFGGPTTPAEGHMGAGEWRFGVIYPDGREIWEPDLFPVPPLTEVWLTVAGRLNPD